ncbi:MAG: nuclear transport factor 2 family protein [Pseudomonadales bacterium]
MLANIGSPPSVTEQADRMAILDILALHSRGLDRLDPSLIKHSYWADAEVDYGAFKGPAQQFAELVVHALGEQYELTRHSLGNSLIVFATDTVAKSESGVDAAHLFHGAESEMQFAGRYLDTLEKRDKVWKIRRREVVIDWSRVVTVTDERESEGFAALGKGAHGADDPSHAFFHSNAN